MNQNNISLLITVSGRVQGVGYRFYTLKQANALSLSGWVKNKLNGAVLIHVQGPIKKIDTFIKLLEKGPQHSLVKEIKKEEVNYDEKLTSFNIKY